MQIGRLVYINQGPYKGNVAVIVDVVDQNRVSLAAALAHVEIRREKGDKKKGEHSHLQELLASKPCS